MAIESCWRTALLFALAASLLRAQDASERDRALVSVAGLDLASADMVSWCEEKAPPASRAMRAAWQRWRTQNAMDEITGQLSPELVARARATMAPRISATRERMAAMGAPATACQQLAVVWSSETFDVRARYPMAYARPGAGAVTATSGTTLPAQPAAGPVPRAGRQFDARYYYETTRPAGDVYTVAQLEAMFNSWYGTPRNRDRALDRLKASGTLFVRGRVVPHLDWFYLETNDGTMTSRHSVVAGINLGAFEGQEVTLALRLKELPVALIYPGETRLVRDPSALRASTLPSAPGLRRLKVDVARITASPGRGLAASRIHGVLYHGRGMTGANGYEFREEVRLLLTDGWAYLREDIAPADIDVELSRRLEPQNWVQWRQARGGYEFLDHDDQGRPVGDWTAQDGSVMRPWTANQRLTGAYAAASFSGTAGTGGTYAKTTYSLSANGRYERLGFTRASSGTMAANAPGGFVAGATGASDGRGTTASAGGGTDAVVTTARTQDGDGARNRGTYRLDGMTIELRNDAGEVTRHLCVPLDTRGDSFYFLGRSFSRTTR